MEKNVDKAWFCSLGVGRGLHKPSPYKTTMLRIVAKLLRLGQIFWHDLKIDLRVAGS